MAMPHPMRGAAAIVGVADLVDASGQIPGTVHQIEARMVREALDDAGLTLADVDGVAINNAAGWAASLELAERLGISPRWTDTTQTGGSSFEIHVQHAAAAIALGLADCIVVVYAATPRSDFKRGGQRWGSRALAAGAPTPNVEWEMPHGLRLPMGAYALAASRHR